MSILSYFQRARPSAREAANDLNLDEPDQHTAGRYTFIFINNTRPANGESVPAEGGDNESTTGLDDSCGPPAAKCPVVSVPDCGDVAGFVGTRILSAQCGYDLLVNYFKPGADYAFPRGTNGVHFNFAGLYSTHGLCTVSKRKVAFAFPIMGQIQALSSAVP